MRGRVALLAGTVVVLLSATLLILIWVLRTTQADLVARSNKHLEAVARSMAVAYQNRSNRSISLAITDPVPPLPGPRPLRFPEGSSATPTQTAFRSTQGPCLL